VVPAARFDRREVRGSAVVTSLGAVVFSCGAEPLNAFFFAPTMNLRGETKPVQPKLDDLFVLVDRGHRELPVWPSVPARR
jgi:hypothetical protein